MHYILKYIFYLKQLEQFLTELQREIAKDPNLGNAALLQFLLEHEKSLPACLILSADFKPSFDEDNGTSKQQQEGESQSSHRINQLSSFSDSIHKEEMFWFYRMPITLASFELEVNSHRDNIVNGAFSAVVSSDGNETHLSRLSSKEFDFLLYFLQQVSKTIKFCFYLHQLLFVYQ